MKLLMVLTVVALFSAAKAGGDPVYHNGRVDTRLTATYGSCFQDEFRHFTLLDASRWDGIRWTVEGNMYAGNRLFRDADKTEWPGGEPNYKREMRLFVDGRKLDDSAMRIREVEHQFDFHKVSGGTGEIEFQRTDMVISSLQWVTGLNLRNKTNKEQQITLELTWQSSVSIDDSTARIPRYVNDPEKRLVISGRHEEGFFMTDSRGLETFIKTDNPPRVIEEEGLIRAVWNIHIPAKSAQALSVVTQAGWGSLLPVDLDPAISELNPPRRFVHKLQLDIPCDPRFQHMMFGTKTTPLVYQFKVPKSGKYQVAVGLIDTSWNAKANHRPDFRCEGERAQTAVLMKECGLKIATVLTFEAEDVDGDGLIDLSMNGTDGKTENSVGLSFIDIFEPGNAPTPDEIFAGGMEDLAIASVNAYRRGEPFQLAFTNACTPEKLVPEKIVARQEMEFDAVCRMLGLRTTTLDWEGLEELCDAKRNALYRTMPQLEGVDASWRGTWSYIFDILRAGTLPKQGQCKDIWMVADLLFYRWTFYWDTGNHTYAHWDANVAARTILTYLNGIREDGGLPLHFNPEHSMRIQPQLMNIPITLWDCYLVNRDQSLLEEAYPLLVRHQDWIDTKRNKSPDGPLADIGHNIDYGTPLRHEYQTIWVDMNMFQVNQYRTMAKMAGAINKSREEIDRWNQKADKLQAGIQQYMWNKELGTYNCVEANSLKPIPTGSPIEFYGMTAGVVTQEQARQLVKRVTDPEKYAAGGKYPHPLPSAPYDDPSFVIRDGWGGTIWLIQPYYTVRGLSDYGFQDEAADITTNLFDMVARDYLRTGTIWEQYRPDNGQGIHLSHFTSSITVNVSDMLLRGLFGFERIDDPNAFMLTPRPEGKHWQGITNLLTGNRCRLDIRVKNTGSGDVACKLVFHNLPPDIRFVELYSEDMEGSQKIATLKLRKGEVQCKLPKQNETRYRFMLVP